MMFILILLVLPVLVLAKLDIYLSGELKRDTFNLSVNLCGEEVAGITDTERNTFNLTDNNLKDAINHTVFKRPDDVYLHNPTPWGDLYQLYGWQEVTRSLIPQDGKIVNISLNPVIIFQQVFENNTSKPLNFSIDVSQNVQNKVSSSWSMGGEFSVVQNISYDIRLKAIEVGEEISFSYNSFWGENAQHFQNVSFESPSKEVLLEPGYSIVSQLQATKCEVQFEIQYEASIHGYMAINYNDTYKDYKYWGLDIAHCMNNFGLSTQKVSREIIDIRLYTDFKVVVLNKTNDN